MRDRLFSGRLARYASIENDDEWYLIRDLHLLTNKPVMYVCNVDEQDVARENDHVAAVRQIAAKEGAKVATVSAEVAELPTSERKGFLKGLGLQESGLDKIVREGYDLLRLIMFFTVGPKEVHAWTVCKGAAAP